MYVPKRFAILRHDHPFLHWDFLLEGVTMARTWRLLEEPVRNKNIQAEALPDHRLKYLEYEGPVSGGRGSVTQFCCGEFTVIQASEGTERIALTECDNFAEAMLSFDANGSPVWRFS